MQFHDQALKIMKPVLQSIIKHPFLLELHSGKLNRQIFEYYLKQDKLYLQTYHECLLSLAQKTDEQQKLILIKLAEAIQSEEQELSQQQHDATMLAWRQQTLANFAYTQYLLLNVNNSYELGLAAILPCYWIYQQVAHHFVVDKDHPFYEWYVIYQSDDFASQTQHAIQLVNTAYTKAGEKKKELMLTVFEQGLYLEYAFWDDAYCQHQLLNLKK
jgi:thiaminase (transcriptional activator TenA)